MCCKPRRAFCVYRLRWVIASLVCDTIETPDAHGSDCNSRRRLNWLDGNARHVDGQNTKREIVSE